MNVSVGIYELLGAAVPGSLYLALVAYLAERLGWPGLDRLDGEDSTLIVLGVILLSFLLGTLLGPVGHLVSHRVLPPRVSAQVRAVGEFQRRNPTLADRSFLELDHFTLIAGLRHHAPESAATADRFRATAHMLRSSSVALALGAAVAVVEAIAGTDLARAAATAVLLAALAVAAMLRGRTFGYWTFTSTLQAAAWLPDPDSVPPRRAA